MDGIKTTFDLASDTVKQLLSLSTGIIGELRGCVEVGSESIGPQVFCSLARSLRGY